MSLETRIFYVDQKGVDKASALNALFTSLRRDAIQDLSIIPQTNGKTAVFVTFEATDMRLTGSSPVDGMGTIVGPTAVYLTFDEDINTNTDVVAKSLEAYKSGTASAVVGSDLTITGNMIRVDNLIAASTGLEYQLIIRSTMPAVSGRTLGQNVIITWKT